MSQYPPNPNYNPYEQNPNDPNALPGTVYGGNPPSGGQSPYNPYSGNPPSNPGGNSGPYGAYPPTPPPPSTAPNTNYNPYDPNAQTYVSSGSNPGYGTYPPDAYQAPPPPVPPAPRRGGPSARVIVLAVVALVIIIGGILVGFVVVNGQRSSADATATAQANATATAHANASATANAALTATAIATTYPFSANQVLSDPLSDNNKGSNWQTDSFCQFTGSAYHVSDNQTNTFSTCFGTNTNFSNFTFEAEMNISKGDGGGLIFRGNSKTDQLYRVTFFTNGHYGIYVYVDNTGTNARILKYDTFSGVDLTNTNTISAVARGSTMSVYLNHTLITSITDSTYMSGAIGFSAYDLTNATEVIFTNAKVWQLP